MKKISPFLVFAIYFTVILLTEGYLKALFIDLQIPEYRAGKAAYIFAATLLLFLAVLLKGTSEFKILFSVPSCGLLILSFFFCCSLNIAGIAMISNQIFLTALISPETAISFWNFTGADSSFGPDYNYLGYRSGPINFSLFIATQFVLLPLVEELYFRGIIIHKFRLRYSSGITVVLTSILFTCLHPSNQYFTTFFFSILISYFFLKYGNIWLVALIHGLSNLFDWLYSGFGGIAYIESRTEAELPLISTWLPEIFIAVLFYALTIYLLGYKFKDGAPQVTSASQPQTHS